MKGGGGDNRFIYSAVVFAVAVMFLMPTMVNLTQEHGAESSALINEILGDYGNFTGSQSNLGSEDVWLLSGIYTPYLGGSYGYEANGWLYGSKIGVSGDYLPTQYVGGVMSNCGVRYNSDLNLYQYTGDSYDGHHAGDTYTAVTMDASAQSDIFFTSSGKNVKNSYYWYDYTGYRYEFTPAGEYQILGADGDIHSINASNAGLSLIWYNYMDMASGLSGQLVISSDEGVAYITEEDIISRFVSSTSTAKFEMVFNGVSLNVYIRINPYYLSQGMTVNDCWSAGYWEIMVTSNSVKTSSYLGADYAFNVYSIWDTFLDLFTFNTADYGLDGNMGTVASICMCVPMYGLLIAIGLTCYPVLIVAGVVAAVQGIATAMTHWSLF